MTKAELISDIMLRITKGKPADDLELEPTQVGYWASIVLPGLIQASLNERLKRGESVDPDYILLQDCADIVKIDEQCLNGDCLDRFTATLTYPPLQLWKDRGMVQVMTTEFENVHRIGLDQLFIIWRLPFSKPREGNLVYTRIRNVLTIYGLIDGAEEELKLVVAYVPNQDINVLADTAIIYVGSDIMDALADAVEAKARRQQLESPSDLENDGEDDPQANQ